MRRNTEMCRRKGDFLRIIQQIYMALVLFQETPYYYILNSGGRVTRACMRLRLRA
jgi:hypothetical protein